MDSAAGRTHADIIEAFGGAGAYARAIAIPDGHARAMKTRNSIPQAYWRRTARAAARCGLLWITFEAIATIAARLSEKRLAETQS